MKETKEQKYSRLNRFEEEYYKKGYKVIAGVDEVGRGPLAGPAVVAAVILDPNKPIYGLDDSKKLSKKKIEELTKEIYEKALCAKVYEIKVQTIEKMGIRQAVLYGMRNVVRKLSIKPDFVLFDYEDPNVRIDSLSMKKGDANSNSIAAASIIAKDFRDKKMEKLAMKYPGYDLENNVGYGTKRHIQGLEEFGYIEGLHRKNFKPVSIMYEKKQIGKDRT